jgi:hypothetical protein
MNIIENVWAYLDRRVHTQDQPPQNSEELWHALQEEWYQVSASYITNLYESLPRRVLSLVQAKGGHTEY